MLHIIVRQLVWISENFEPNVIES